LGIRGDHGEQAPDSVFALEPVDIVGVPGVEMGFANVVQDDVQRKGDGDSAGGDDGDE